MKMRECKNVKIRKLEKEKMRKWEYKKIRKWEIEKIVKSDYQKICKTRKQIDGKKPTNKMENWENKIMVELENEKKKKMR